MEDHPLFTGERVVADLGPARREDALPVGSGLLALSFAISGNRRDFTTRPVVGRGEETRTVEFLPNRDDDRDGDEVGKKLFSVLHIPLELLNLALLVLREVLRANRSEFDDENSKDDKARCARRFLKRKDRHSSEEEDVHKEPVCALLLVREAFLLGWTSWIPLRVKPRGLYEDIRGENDDRGCDRREHEECERDVRAHAVLHEDDLRKDSGEEQKDIEHTTDDDTSLRLLCG